MPSRPLEIRGTLETTYPDVLTPEALAALEALAPLDADRKARDGGAHRRGVRRACAIDERIAFLDPQATIARTQIKVQDARDGKFVGSEIPGDLQRQWIQGTGPAAPSPARRSRTSIRNVAYALLSGADGWMFDGEDALGQVSTMSLDNQRNLKLAIHRDPRVPEVAEQVAGEMNTLGARLLRPRRSSTTGGSSSTSRRRSSAPAGCISTTGTSGTPTARGFSASIVDLDAVRRQQPRSSCRDAASSLVLYLPKIQTAEEAALWNDILVGARSASRPARSARSRSTCWSSSSRRASS